jgi:hypothetical protein
VILRGMSQENVNIESVCLYQDKREALEAAGLSE